MTDHKTGHCADAAWCSCGWMGPGRGASYADQESARLAAEAHAARP